jgi:hypothetical protein
VGGGGAASFSRTICKALRIDSEREETAVVVIGWLLFGALLALLGALIIGFQLVLRGFADVQKELREVRTQFDTVIRLQNALQSDRRAFELNARYGADQDRTLQ